VFFFLFVFAETLRRAMINTQRPVPCEENMAIQNSGKGHGTVAEQSKGQSVRDGVGIMDKE